MPTGVTLRSYRDAQERFVEPLSKTQRHMQSSLCGSESSCKCFRGHFHCNLVVIVRFDAIVAEHRRLSVKHLRLESWPILELRQCCLDILALRSFVKTEHSSVETRAPVYQVSALYSRASPDSSAGSTTLARRRISRRTL